MRANFLMVFNGKIEGSRGGGLERGVHVLFTPLENNIVSRSPLGTFNLFPLIGGEQRE